MKPGEVKGVQTPPHANSTQNLHSHFYHPTHTNKTYLSTSYLQNMQQPCEIIGLHVYDEFSHQFNTHNSCDDALFPNNNSQIHLHHHHQLHEFSSNTSSSIEAPRDQNLSISHERKLKRLKSNRESARRSRMRKRKQLEELQFQVVRIENLYHNLTEKFIHLLECNHQILQENAQLKEEVSFYRKIVNDLQIPVRDVEDSNQFYDYFH